MQRLIHLGLCVALLAPAISAQAQTARSGGEASAQLMQQMQQLASERTQLQAENARLKQELEVLKTKTKGLETEKATLDKRVQSSEGALARSTASSENLNQSLTQQHARMEELVGKFRETAGALKSVETERAQLQAQLAASQQAFDTCAEKNVALYD